MTESQASPISVLGLNTANLPDLNTSAKERKADSEVTPFALQLRKAATDANELITRVTGTGTGTGIGIGMKLDQSDAQTVKIAGRLITGAADVRALTGEPIVDPVLQQSSVQQSLYPADGVVEDTIKFDPAALLPVEQSRESGSVDQQPVLQKPLSDRGQPVSTTDQAILLTPAVDPVGSGQVVELVNSDSVPTPATLTPDGLPKVLEIADLPRSSTNVDIAKNTVDANPMATIQGDGLIGAEAAIKLTPVVETLQMSRAMKLSVHEGDVVTLTSVNLALQRQAGALEGNQNTKSDAQMAVAVVAQSVQAGKVTTSEQLQAIAAGGALALSRTQAAASGSTSGLHSPQPNTSLLKRSPAADTSVKPVTNNESLTNKVVLSDDGEAPDSAETTAIKQVVTAPSDRGDSIQMKVDNLASAAMSSASEGSDNMLTALGSGTITAPQVSRADGVSSVINAPFTLSLSTPDSDESLAGNVRWMASDSVKNAVINVTPSGMGPISVKLDIENEQMNVSIIATQGGTREALDAMLPRLREQLLGQGYDSVRVDVSDGRSDNAKGNNPQQQFNQSRGEFSAYDQSNDQAGNKDSMSRNERNERDASDVSADRLGGQSSIAGNADSSTSPDSARGGQAIYDAYV